MLCKAAKFTPGSEQAPLFDSFDGIFPQIADFANFAITVGFRVTTTPVTRGISRTLIDNLSSAA